METKFGKFSASQSQSPIFFNALEKANDELGSITFRYFSEGEWFVNGDEDKEYQHSLRVDAAQSVQSVFENEIRGQFAEFESETGLKAKYATDEVYYIALEKIDRAAQQA